MDRKRLLKLAGLLTEDMDMDQMNQMGHDEDMMGHEDESEHGADDDLLSQIKDLVHGDEAQHDPAGVLSQISDLISQHESDEGETEGDEDHEGGLEHEGGDEVSF